jgi:hypothetical protein
MIGLILAAALSLTTQERADLNCVEASLKGSEWAQANGKTETADQAWETALFFEGRLTAEDAAIDWVELATSEVRANPHPFAYYAPTGSACAIKERHFLRMPDAIFPK